MKCMNKNEKTYLFVGKDRLILHIFRITVIPIGILLSFFVNYIAFKVTFTGTWIWFKTFVIIIALAVLISVVVMYMGFTTWLNLTEEDIKKYIKEEN